MVAGLLLGLIAPVIVSAAIENNVEVPAIDNTPTFSEENVECVAVEHAHWHTNTSQNDDDNEFWGAVHSFAIVLDDGFLNDMDTSSMMCTDGDEIYTNCGFDPVTDLDSGVPIASSNAWNDTDVFYQTLNWIAGDPVGLVWEYGQSDPSDIDLKPWLASGNIKQETIAFEPLASNTVETSATTESWTKMEFWAIDPDDKPANLNNWSQVYTQDVVNFGSNQVDTDNDFVYWYGINARLTTSFDACIEEDLECDYLEIDPTTATVGVDDLFSDIPITVTAYDTDDNVMSDDDIDFIYSAAAFGDAAGDTTANGAFDGSTGDGNHCPGSPWAASENSLTIGDDTVCYQDSEPGDTIYVEVVGAPQCNAQFELPYCADLTILNPPNTGFVVPGPVYNETIDIEAFANNGEAWPFEFDYNSTNGASTFDGVNPIHTTFDTSVEYSSAAIGITTVRVSATDNLPPPNHFCTDSFNFTLEEVPVDCVELIISSPPSPVPAGDMAGGILITWDNTMTDGSFGGPWSVTTSGGGTFYEFAGGPVVPQPVTGYTNNSIYYVGADGDSITVFDENYPFCTDQIESETIEELPVCLDLTLDDPAGLNDLETFFDQTEVCFDFEVTVDDPAFIGNLQANGYVDDTQAAFAAGPLILDVNETGGNDVGNPATTPLDAGVTTYTGTVCWQNFEEGNFLSLFVVGSEVVCAGEFEIPEEPHGPEPYCVDLELDPNLVMIPTGDPDAGTIDITVDTFGSDVTWTGDLIIEDTLGTCDLFYGNGTPSEFPDGHLLIPVSGLNDTVLASAEGCLAADSVSAYILGDEVACSDEFPINEGPLVPVCIDLEFDPDQIIVGEDGTATTTLNLTSDLTNQNLVVEYTGCAGGEIQYDGSTYTDRMEQTITGSDSLLLSFSNVCEAAVIDAFVEDNEAVCSDELGIEILPPEEPVCEELFFDPDDITVIETEDKTVDLHLDSELDDQTLVIEYDNCPDSGIEVNGASYDERAELVLDGDQWLEVTFNNLCEDAEIRAYVEDNEDVCADELDLNFVELGEFSKYIFTFNFAVEKDNFSDDGIFFSHDEDRSFYTLEYEPAGGENSITFTDDMWDNDLDGQLGNGDESGGSIDLATSYDELTRSDVDPNSVYEYNTITHFGFGDRHELRSTDVYNYVDSNYSRDNFETFVAYIKYDDNRESEVIYECDDEIGNDICYDQDTRPEDTGSLTIHNAGEIDEDAVIRIRYVGIVVSGLDCASTTDECLTEEFQNNAEVKVYSGIDSLQANAKLVVLCSYLVTRNAGDVYLEVALEGGSDVACIFVEEDEAQSADYRNVDALIILEADPEAYIPGDFTPVDEAADLDGADLETGFAGSTISLCDDDEYEDNLIGNLSSYVCEIVSSVNELWQSALVESTTETLVSQATRNTETNQSLSVFSDWAVLESQLSNINNPESGILYFDGANEDTITLGALTIPEGAWTIIVENADLVIDSNIKYADSTNFANLPSIAFVVLGGNIHIDNDALNLVGVYFTDQSITGDERSAVNEPLEIHGSVYGHVQPLLDAAKYVGSPGQDEGGVQIYYDERIILNTPPALSEYVDISTEEAVN